MIKDFNNILSIIEEGYNIKKEEKGLFFKKTVEIEKLFRKTKKVYDNGKVVFEEHIWNGCEEIIRETKNYTYFSNGEYKLIIKRLNSTGDVTCTWEYLLNSHDYIINSYDSRFREECVYDFHNNLICKNKFYGTELMSKNEWEYDNNGNCIKEHRQEFDKGKITEENILLNTYDIGGKIKTIIQKNKSYIEQKYRVVGDYEKTTKLKYNTYGDIIHKEDICNGQISHYNYEYKYNAHNHYIEKRCYVSGADASRGDWFYKYKIEYK